MRIREQHLLLFGSGAVPELHRMPTERVLTFGSDMSDAGKRKMGGRDELPSTSKVRESLLPDRGCLSRVHVINDGDQRIGKWVASTCTMSPIKAIERPCSLLLAGSWSWGVLSKRRPAQTQYCQTSQQ